MDGADHDARPSPETPTRCDALGKAISSTLISAISDFDTRAAGAAESQDALCRSLDRLTSELDRLLEEAPLPFVVHHAAKVLTVQKRIRALNALLGSIQHRIDEVDRLLSAGASSHGKQPGASSDTSR